MIISIIGNNSSGKTTILKELFKSSAFHNAVLVKEYEYFLLKYIIKNIKTNKVAEIKNKFINENKKTVIGKLTPYIIWFDLVIEYFYYKIFCKNKLVIKERYAYDFLFTWRELNISNTLIELLFGLFPRPDLIFYIYVKPEIAYQRRKHQKDYISDYKLDFFVKKTKMYKEFCDKKGAVIIENNKNDEINNVVKKILWYLKVKNNFLKINSIAISGLDGAGKSTTVNNLKDFLRLINVKHKNIHFYYNYVILKVLRLFIKQMNKTEEEIHKKSIENEKKIVKQGKGKFWTWFVILDALVQYYFVKIFSFNKVIIFDRFFQDFIISFQFINAPYNEKMLLNQNIPRGLPRGFLQEGKFENRRFSSD